MRQQRQSAELRPWRFSTSNRSAEEAPPAPSQPRAPGAAAAAAERSTDGLGGEAHSESRTKARWPQGTKESAVAAARKRKGHQAIGEVALP